MVRNLVFSWVRWLERGEYERFSTVESVDRHDRWDPARVAAAMAEYGASHDEVRTDAEARGGQWFVVSEAPQRWTVRQVLVDPEADGDWSIEAEVDLVRSREEARPVVLLSRLGPTAA